MRWHSSCESHGMITIIFCLSGLVIFTAWDSTTP
jgi:hypothetical protein